MKAIFAESYKTIIHAIAQQEGRKGEAFSLIIERQDFNPNLIAVQDNGRIDLVMLLIGELAANIEDCQSLLFFGTDAEADKLLAVFRAQEARSTIRKSNPQIAPFRKNDRVRIKAGIAGAGTIGRVSNCRRTVGHEWMVAVDRENVGRNSYFGTFRAEELELI